MRAIVVMFDSLNRHLLSPYADTMLAAPNFARLAHQTVTFDNFYAGSMPCIPARRELHTGRYNFLHRSWGPLEPFDDSMPELLGRAGVHTHLASDHPHYWEDGGATYHTRYTTWEFFRGQEGDPWKGVVDARRDAGAGTRDRARHQDRVNRSFMTTEADHVQTRTVDAGIEFIETNRDADRWLLQVELFDPHEPFFAPAEYTRRYLGEDQDTGFDWPGYQKVTESPDLIEEARRHYASLVTMCDHSLGRVLDAMDAHGMWDDTMLIVHTDHGFLLGEHGWWAKAVQPWFNELVHLPMFVWDPRTKGHDTRRAALAQTIDIAPTLLRFFGVEPTSDMQGRDLAAVLDDDRAIHHGALFGVHGGHVNVTDGRYVYMRAADDPSNSPLEEFTLMPTHMRARFSPAELADWQPAEAFPFTKGARTMRIPAAALWMNPWQHGTLLFDLDVDPTQNHPIVDDPVELRMAQLLVDLMRDTDAPAGQYQRLGLPADGPVEHRHLHAAAHKDRAADTAQRLPPTSTLTAADLLTTPLLHLLELPGARDVIRRHAPDLVSTELVSVDTGVSLLDLARHAAIPASLLIVLGQELSDLPGRPGGLGADEQNSAPG